MPAPRLRTIVVAATKGGVGKTTLSAAFAVRAARESSRVALLDLDPQESLASWWDRRKRPSNPHLFEIDATMEGIGLIAGEGYEWVIVDTPPAILDRIEPAIAMADLVLIPTRASPLDIEAVRIIDELCERHRKAHAYIINAADPRWKITKTAAQYIRANGGTVLEPVIRFRLNYAAAMTLGRAGPEMDKDAAAEIDEIWNAVRDMANAAAGAGR